MKCLRKNCFVVICLILCLLIVLNLLASANKISAVVSNFTQIKTILIDIGHGGEDSGAIGFEQVCEKNINLSISLLLQDVLVKNGYRVIMTREDDSDLADHNLGSVSERKRSDMQKRANLINGSNADIAISIHQNYFEQLQYSGLQVFYAKENSKELANVIQQTVVNEIQPNNKRQISLVDNKYLLNNSNIPMVIVECGFISNKEESINLQDENYQLKLATSIFNAIEKYYS